MKQRLSGSQGPTEEPQKSAQEYHKRKPGTPVSRNGIISVHINPERSGKKSVYKRMSFFSVQTYKHWLTSELWSRRHFHSSLSSKGYIYCKARIKKFYLEFSHFFLLIKLQMCMKCFLRVFLYWGGWKEFGQRRCRKGPYSEQSGQH